jgi:hypothetical protein
MTEERQNPASPHELTLDPKTIDVLIANIIPTSKYFESRFDNLQYQVNEIKEDIKNLEVRMDKRFEQVDKRFEQVDKRFEQVDGCDFWTPTLSSPLPDAAKVGPQCGVAEFGVGAREGVSDLVGVGTAEERVGMAHSLDFWTPTLSSPTWSSLLVVVNSQ